MSDVSGIPYMGSMGTGNFFAPQFSYNPQMSAGQIQSNYMPEAIQNQNVFNSLYGGGIGGGFGRDTANYAYAGAAYGRAVPMSDAAMYMFSDTGGPASGGGQNAVNNFLTGSGGYNFPSIPNYSGGLEGLYGGGSGLGGSNFNTTAMQNLFGNWNAPQQQQLDWGNLFGGGGAKADPYPGMSMPGGLGSPMSSSQQQQPTDYSSLFGRGVGGTSGAPETSQPRAPITGFNGTAGFGSDINSSAGTPGSSALDWSKLFGGGKSEKTDPYPGMSMPGGLNTPLGTGQPADFGSRFGDWGKQPSGVRGEIVPEERNTTANMYTIPAGGGGFGGGGAENQLYGANAGSLGGEGGIGFNPITGTGPQGDTADSLAAQARARLADLMNNKGDRAIELKADPREMIGPPDPREAPDYNPFEGMRVPLPQARPEGADALPAQSPATQVYPGDNAPRPPGEMALANSPTLRGVNPRLARAVEGGASFLPPGYTVEAVSGVREGKSQSYHSGGRAMDVKIIGPDGPIPHKGADDTGMYTLLARGVKTWVQQNDPSLASQMGYGGAFGTQLGGGGVPDLMHYDLGGSRGRMVPDVQFSRLQPLSEAERNAMPAYIPLLGANQVPLDIAAPRATASSAADVNRGQEIPRPQADVPSSGLFPEGVPLPAPRPNAEANLAQAHSLLDSNVMDLVRKNSPSSASMVPSSIASQSLREALGNTFTGGMIRSNITPENLAKGGITQADFDKAYNQGRPSTVGPRSEAPGMSDWLGNLGKYAGNPFVSQAAAAELPGGFPEEYFNQNTYAPSQRDYDPAIFGGGRDPNAWADPNQIYGFNGAPGGARNSFASSAADVPQTTNLPPGDLTQRLMGDPFDPGNYNTLDQASDLVTARSPYMAQLNDSPDLMNTLKALAVSEIGQGRSNEQYAAFIESVLNQSAARNRDDLAKFLSGGYYQPVNQGTMGSSYQYLRDNPEMSANIGRMISEVGAGSNVSNLAMENSSNDPNYPQFGSGAMQPQYGGFLNMFLPGSNEYLTSKLNPSNDPRATGYIGAGAQQQYRDFWQQMMPAGTAPWGGR